MMRRSLAALTVTAAVAGSAVVAQASGLSVNAGVLQTFTAPIDIDTATEPPETQLVTVKAIVHRYQKNNGSHQGTDYGHSNTTWEWTTPVGYSYTLAWPAEMQDCGDFDDPPGGAVQGATPFIGPGVSGIADEDIVYVACWTGSISNNNNFTFSADAP